MRLLTAAYGVLGDEVKRREYDDRRRLFEVAHGPRLSRAERRVQYQTGDYDSGNPNGAGQFAGILALILGLALLGGAVSGGLGHDPAALVIFGGIALALTLAAVFFSSNSPLAKAAHSYMEGEPRGYRVDYGVRYEPWAEAASAEPATEEGEHKAAFESLVDEALADLPEEYREYMANVVVQVEDEPDAETLHTANVPHGGTLLGLYHGVPLTKQGAAGAGPEVISIYRKSIEGYCGEDPDRIREQVRATVLHEIAHHFGIDHDDMPEWVK
jgi:predicted Zn-dependent protease with MMP-like domain